MQEKDLRELIDRYLLGTINADEKITLSNMRKTNPEVDLRVKQNVEAFKVLQYGRYQQIRQTLKVIDATDANPSNLSPYRRWIIISVVFVVSLSGLWFWLVNHYSPLSLAGRYFQPVSDEFFLNHDMNHENILAWNFAEEAFMNRDFRSAISSFKSFTEDEDYTVSTQARWNILLARFGSSDPGSSWRSDLKDFELEAPEHLKGQAGELLRIIDSPFYRFIIFEIPRQLSALKPQIM